MQYLHHGSLLLNLLLFCFCPEHALYFSMDVQQPTINQSAEYLESTQEYNTIEILHSDV